MFQYFWNSFDRNMSAIEWSRIFPYVFDMQGQFLICPSAVTDSFLFRHLFFNIPSVKLDIEDGKQKEERLILPQSVVASIFCFK